MIEEQLHQGPNIFRSGAAPDFYRNGVDAMQKIEAEAPIAPPRLDRGLSRIQAAP